MNVKNGPFATVWERERGREQGCVLIPLHRVVEETVVVKIPTRRFVVRRNKLLLCRSI